MPCIYSKVMPSPVAKLTIAHLHAQLCVASIKLVTLLCSRNEGPFEKRVTEWNSEPVDTGSGPQGAANSPHITESARTVTGTEILPPACNFSLTRTLWRVTTNFSINQILILYFVRHMHSCVKRSVGESFYPAAWLLSTPPTSYNGIDFGPHPKFHPFVTRINPPPHRLNP